MAAALVVFRQKGFSATRVEDISKAAGIAKGTCYLYFKSRNEIAEAILETVVQRYLARARELVPPDGSGPADTVRLLTNEIRSLTREAGEQISLIPVLFSVLVERLVSGDSELPRRLGEAFSSLAGAWSEILAATGYPDSLQFARTVVSMLDGIILHAALFDDPLVELNRSAETLCGLLEKGILGGIG